MMKNLFVLTIFVSVLIFGCDGNSAKSDADIILIADEDVSDDFSDDILTDLEENDSDLDEITDDPVENINNGLDESFLEPNKGFSFKIVAPILPAAPSGQDLKPEEKPHYLQGELIDKSGNKFILSNIDNTFAADYEGYLYITSASEYSGTTYYSANILPSFETLDWMAANDTDTVNSTYFYLYLYRNDFVNDNLLRICPDAIPDPAKESALKLFIDGETWNFDENFGIMVSTYLTFDKKAIASFFGDELHKLCYCYDVSGGNYTQRDCTPGDMDLDPLPPTSPTPEDGAENVENSVELSWKASSDPDGGDVKYTLLFGTESVPADKVLENSTDLKWKPEKDLDLNTQYFWQVIVTDDEGNSVKGKIWTFNTDDTVVTVENHDFLILVNSTLKGKLDNELNQYIEDAESEGYLPAIRYWMPGGAEKMKEIIKKSYDEYSIKGAVLIGDLPAADFEQYADYGEGYDSLVYEEFPSEFFFMDMDGVWEDSDTNGIYDKYPEDLSLEIFSSRITGSFKEVSDYLGRAHEYRKNGSFFDSRNFFSFIDDDWSVYIDESGKVWEDYMGIKNSSWELGSIYGENYERREDPENTTKTTYMDFLTKNGAEYVYQWIHSDPQKIYFDDNFSPNPENILTIDEIINGKVKGSFYNLFDCSISRYTAPGGNIASEYLNGEYGLATLGSTKTGGIFNPEVMNIALANGENWGASYQLWVNDIWANHENYGFDHAFIESWWLGMMVQGDPLLTLTDKKTFTVKSTYPKKFYTLEQLRILNNLKRIR